MQYNFMIEIYGRDMSSQPRAKRFQPPPHTRFCECVRGHVAFLSLHFA